VREKNETIGMKKDCCHLNELLRRGDAVYVHLTYKGQIGFSSSLLSTQFFNRENNINNIIFYVTFDSFLL
jgi:hypothetical protein